SSLNQGFAAFAVLGAMALSGPAATRPVDMLTLDDSRRYMLELINQDRAAKGLLLLEMDAIATKTGQEHAEDMAASCYLSHFDRIGRLPDQRYTEQGGRDRVAE